MKTGLMALGAALAFAPTLSHATTITFDDVVSGATIFDFDGDMDGIADVTFSTDDVNGFNTFGPGANQRFIDEPGIEGTTGLAPDLRVDFLVGAEGMIEFGFAVSAAGDVLDAVTFTLFDSMDTMLATGTSAAIQGMSDFPENRFGLTFAGVAAYGLFDFSDVSAARYIIDNFEGDFGTVTRPPLPPMPPAPVPVSEPGTLALLGLGLVCLAARRRS